MEQLEEALKIMAERENVDYYDVLTGKLDQHSP